jgi:beta-glucosidase-like glycosyl hydrolase
MKRFYASDTEMPEPWEAAHTAEVRSMAARGIVLLENRGALPLQAGCRVALYGYGARNTAFCGYGAASINSRVWTSIEQGLAENGIQVTTKAYLDRYEAAMQEEEEAYFRALRAGGGTLFDRLVRMYGLQFTPVCQEPITQADVDGSATDTAIFVITRVSGEGADRKPIAGDYDLSDAEKSNLLFLSAHYKSIIVLLNTVGVIDTAFLRRLPHLDALLTVGLNGGITGNAVADVLTGAVTPEGKLAATWAQRYEDYPSAGTFGLMDGDVDDERYTEGIYVGYRYFDSFGIVPAYPFGYGLSYTDFTMQEAKVVLDADKVRLTATVANIGSRYAGREVVQLYASCPAAKLQQPAQRLAGFQKTKLLAPGERETVTVELEISSLASYSEQDACWMLEQGDYVLRMGNSSRNTYPVAVLRLAENVVIEQCRPFSAVSDLTEELCPAAEQSIYYGQSLPESLPVLCWTATQAPLIHSYSERKRQTDLFEEEAFIMRCREKKYTFQQLLREECTPEELAASLSEEELVLLCVGNVDDTQQSETAGGSLVCASDSTGTDVNGEVPMEMVVGASYTTAALLETRLLPNVPMADGGCGIRLLPEFEMDENGKLLTAGITAIKNGGRLMNEVERQALAHTPKGKRFWQYTTALPMETVMAQTWDMECLRVCGRLEHYEMERFGLKLWLAPGMNIQRNPLCGRNFEYFSEDPLLTGVCATAVIEGIQSGGHAGATIKHVACNNQEENRGGMNAHVSERALREIYLRGYEIAVRRAKPMAIMTGHNLINGVNAAESYDILTAAAREEWGFDGLVMTDWGTTTKTAEQRKYSPSNCDTCIRAGTDLIMPGSKEDLQEIRAALAQGTLSVDNLYWCAVNILRVLCSLLKL